MMIQSPTHKSATNTEPLAGLACEERLHHQSGPISSCGIAFHPALNTAPPQRHPCQLTFETAITVRTKTNLRRAYLLGELGWRAKFKSAVGSAETNPGAALRVLSGVTLKWLVSFVHGEARRKSPSAVLGFRHLSSVSGPSHATHLRCARSPSEYGTGEQADCPQ